MLRQKQLKRSAKPLYFPRKFLKLMKIRFFLLLCLLIQIPGYSQNKPALLYYLPAIDYDAAVPTPSDWLGYEVGEWHCTHDQLLGYMHAIDLASDRVELKEYGRTHENRPLVYLIISDPANLANLDAIKASRHALADPAKSKSVDLKNMPAVSYMGYSVHGNETSGSNAALMVAYYLAAGRSKDLETILKNTVFLLDPCFNPDGMQRFSTWVNSHKSKINAPDPAGDEYNEPWPRGRTNHYGFDLNRDWLVARQPESKGRVALFQEWKPNILTDHHEMGSNATFFFQPGVPSRVNPITPAKNQELTSKVTGYHAKLLSSKNILFYTEENFDDFYYGKGSTYPDVQGAIGILFEQGSSRGTAQETDNGLLTFPYSVRNQVLASLATISAIGDMRVELNEYLREFYVSAIQEAQKSDIKGFVFEDGDLPAREFLNLLGSQGIRVQNLQSDLTVNGTRFGARQAFFVPCEQPQYRLVRAIFERPTAYRDSIFYDISAWTLPDAFGLKWASVNANGYQSKDYSEGISLVSLNPPSILGDINAYAYAIRPNGYNFPKVLYRLLKDGIRVRVAMKPFDADGQPYTVGTLLVATDRQPVGIAGLRNTLNELLAEGAEIGVIDNGLTTNGPDLGSSNFPVVRQPKILMLTGEGVNVADEGEIWHLLDTRFEIPVTLAEVNRFGAINLDKYNVLVLADGSYGGISADKVRQFANDGGTVIATGKALNWIKNNNLASIEFKKSNEGLAANRPYTALENDKGALAMPGAIFESKLDLTHPLCFGYNVPKIPVFLSDTIFVAPGKNPYSTPIQLTEKPLMAGYVHRNILPQASNAAGVVVYGIGKGKLVCFPINPNFRAFWYGTNRLFANALFFGNLINAESTERK